MANDADIQGAAVVSGKGLELVITLGTGVGTALFYDGRLLPHLEFAHHPFRKGETYNEQLGDATRKEVGNGRWNKRVRRAVDTLRAVSFFDHCYIGGGNAKHLTGDLPTDVSTVDNTAGILGGIKLWGSRQLLGLGTLRPDGRLRRHATRRHASSAPRGGAATLGRPGPSGVLDPGRRIVALVVIQNSQRVTIRFWFITGHVRLIWVIVVCLAGGRRLRLRGRPARRRRRRRRSATAD